MLSVAMLQVTTTYADGFHTIIGPDGRPMVVQLKEKKAKPKTVTAEVKAQSETKKEVQLNTEQKQSVQVVQPKTPEPRSPQKTAQVSKLENISSTPKPQLQTPVKNGFEQLDGEDYVSSEFLEDKEFNLEGRKRFYTMPEGVMDSKGGSVRLQTIEREKGVSQTVLNRLFGAKSQEDTGPIVLASSYYRVSQEDAIQGLGQSCFKDKKLKKAKALIQNKDVNLWPRAPIKDEFDYEVVKIDSVFKNIRIQSYASKEKDPTFYWPFVVFLDENACVLEGAGGYKNQQSEANLIEFKNIEGVIQVPKNSHYILMTPLASAIDVDQYGLSNQGQIKLSVIR
ncbi:putative pilus assembly protein FilE [Acinetobacter sp. NCu2D-2]|uniref:putative pilus assembly protein FilE n=1 Tax=Acinetobacter sp. NCu2D-2 TaxID=1608473 RepID=UPI001D0D11CB|nr:putative pilus assembly protein FilE [Acinetobacter sp. NCu2D-2]